MTPDKIFRTTTYLDNDKGKVVWKETPVNGAENIAYIRKDIVDEMIKSAEDHAFLAGAEWIERQVKQEQPDVDLEEEVRNYMEIHHLHIKDGGRVVFDNDDSPNFMCDIRDIARHFYKLGLNTKKEE